MAGNRDGGFQNLGNGNFRVTGARVNPTTGRYITGDVNKTPRSGQSTSGTSKRSK
jgi:hypothetical protein